MKRTLAITVIGIFLAVNIVSAQSMDFYVSSENVWVDDYIDFTCVIDNVIGSIYTRISSPIFTWLNMSEINDSYYTYQYIPQRLGTFEAYCTNGSIESAHENFVVSSLVVEIIECNSIYSDEEVGLSAKVFKHNDTVNEINGINGFGVLDFLLYLDNEYVEINLEYDTSWNIVSSDASFIGKNYTIRLEAEYYDHVNHTETILEVKPALEFSIDSISTLQVMGGENITADIHLEYHDVNVFDSANITVSLDGQELGFVRNSGSLILQTPELVPESYDLVISVDYNNIELSETRQIDYVIFVHGEAIDAEGKGITGNILFSKEGYGKNIVMSNGLYSDTVPYGTYDVTASFVNFVAEFVNVPITSEIINILRFDSFSDLEIGGLKIASGYAIEFTPSFQRVYIEAVYDASKVSDETKTEVYKCSNWNLDARKCNSNWVKTPSEINTVNNKVSFQTDSLSAFIVGEMKELVISANIDRDEYYYGQEIILSGVVRDKSNSVVPDAAVSYNIDDITDIIYTNSNGVFSVNILTPEREGRNIVIINASKVFYESTGTIKEFTVFKKKEVNIIMPANTEINEDEESTLEFVVVNSGDTSLNDIEIAVNGLPSGSEYYPKTIKQMLADEEETVKIIIDPESSDKRVYTILISIESKETSYSDSFVITINKNETEPVIISNETSEVVNEGFNFTAITAYMTGNGTAIMNIGSIALSVVLMVFLGIKMNRKRKFSASTREYIMQLLNTIKAEVLRDFDVKKFVGAAKKRGRPRKNTNAKEKVKRKRGRPRKDKAESHEPRSPEDGYNELEPHVTGVG